MMESVRSGSTSTYDGLENTSMNDTAKSLQKINESLNFRLSKMLDQKEIKFSGNYRYCCIGMVDLVGSTKVTANLSKEKAMQYYSMFLNSMATVVGEYGGSIIKNVGDSLLYYFPKTCDACDKPSLERVLECGLAMIEFRPLINNMLKETRLPNVNYRISCDYGEVATANTPHSDCEDIFGATVNLCSKINHHAKPNTMVIGGDLYQVVKSIKEYLFFPSQSQMSGLRLRYPVYLITRNFNKRWYDNGISYSTLNEL